MSLNKFSELFLNLDSNNSTNEKVEILKNYFSTNDDLENSWSISVSYTHLTLPTKA